MQKLWQAHYKITEESKTIACLYDTRHAKLLKAMSRQISVRLTLLSES